MVLVGGNTPWINDNTGHRAGRAPDLTGVSAQRPLRCVLFVRAGAALDEPALAAWRADMAERYEPAGRRVHEVVRRHKSKPDAVDRLEVLDYVPLP